MVKEKIVQRTLKTLKGPESGSTGLEPHSVGRWGMCEGLRVPGHLGM